MVSLAAAFNSLTTKRATVTRLKAGEPDWIDGYPVNRKPETFEIRVSVQPIKSQNQDEFMRLPEGIRNEAECIAYSRFRLQSGDILDSPWGKLKVLSLDDFQPLGGYTKAIVGGMKP